MTIFISYNHPGRSRLSITLTVVILLLSFQGAFASNKCSELFSNHSNINVASVEQNIEFGTLKKSFVLDPKYTLEIPNQSDIVNQCSLGTCHLHSWVSLLEHNFKSAGHGDIKISTHYLSIMHWIRRSLESLNSNSKDDVFVQLGANVFGSRYSILESGIIPDEVWTGSRDFQSAALAQRISEYLKNMTARAKWEISKQADASAVTKIREKAQRKILNIFENLVGKIPTTFTFHGMEFTPHSFQAKFFPDFNKPITQILVSNERKSPTSLEESSQRVKVILADVNIIEETTRNLLDSGQNVYLSYESNKQFVDDNSGIMSISAFNFPSGAGPLSRSQRTFFGISGPGHLVQIVGYDLNQKTNKVVKWKIKNSWGDASGDHGYYHMFNDYFRTFVTSISFYSDPRFTPTIEMKKRTQLELKL